MLSKAIINYLKENNFYLEKEEKKLYKSSFRFGNKTLNSDLAYFCLHTTEMSFKGRIGSIDNICWYLIYSTYAQRIESLQCFFRFTKRVYSIR